MKTVNVGIDLGTTYSAIATFSKERGVVEVYKNSYDKECTPSVIWIENDIVRIGEEAKTEQKSGNVNTVAFYKNMMGDDNYSAFIDGKEYSAEDLSSNFLKEFIKEIENKNNIKVGGAVITVPAYFNDKQREATIRAGKKAGINVLKIINEPTAAIIAYGLTSEKEKNVLVYDLGGGTFDVTIAHINGTKIDVLATNGNHQLGGKDWDQALIENIKEQFYLEHGINLDDYEHESKELQVKCEEAKKRLSSVQSTTVFIQCEGILGKYEITRESFDDKTYNLLYETILLIQSCFDEISENRGTPFHWKDIDEVVLVGGSTRMPQVKDMILKEYGRPPITKDINVDTIVAVGAAMQAELCVNHMITLSVVEKHSLSEAKPVLRTLTVMNSNILDITSHSLGMLALDQLEKNYINSIIIKKNSKVNEIFSREYIFIGEKLDVYVEQGESRDPHECDIIGKFSITGMEKGVRNIIVVNFLYNSNGIVEVNASIKNGKKLITTREKVIESLDVIIERLDKERDRARKSSCIEVILAIDTSGSMSGDPIQNAQNAAKDFVSQFELKNTYFSILSFADSSTFKCKKVNSIHKINQSIDSLEVGEVGFGTSATPIQTCYASFSKEAYKIIVVLTDGYWSKQDTEIKYAEISKDKGTLIYAIGIGDADVGFLSAISSGKGKKVDISELRKAFKDVAISIATEVGNNSLI